MPTVWALWGRGRRVSSQLSSAAQCPAQHRCIELFSSNEIIKQSSSLLEDLPNQKTIPLLFLMLFCEFVFVHCTCIHMFGCAPVFLHVAGEAGRGLFQSITVPLTPFKHGLSLNTELGWVSAGHSNLPVSAPPRPALPCLPDLLCPFWGFELRFPYFPSKHSYPLNHLLNPQNTPLEAFSRYEVWTDLPFSVLFNCSPLFSETVSFQI